jgi:hypothetical protein
MQMSRARKTGKRTRSSSARFLRIPPPFAEPGRDSESEASSQLNLTWSGAFSDLHVRMMKCIGNLHSNFRSNTFRNCKPFEQR